MKPTPAQVKEAFSYWHKLGKHRGRVTNELKQMALALLDHYPKSEVSKIAGVNPKTIDNWQKKTKADTVNSFISLPVNMTAPDNVMTPPELTLVLPHNIQIKIPQQSAKQTGELICALVKEFSSCSI